MGFDHISCKAASDRGTIFACFGHGMRSTPCFVYNLDRATFDGLGRLCTWLRKRNPWASVVLAVLFAVPLVGVLYTSFVLWYTSTEASSLSPGTFGDMFGALNAIVSALAFMGLLYTINLQRTELQLQRQELKQATEAHRRSALALEQQVMVPVKVLEIETLAKKVERLEARRADYAGRLERCGSGVISTPGIPDQLEPTFDFWRKRADQYTEDAGSLEAKVAYKVDGLLKLLDRESQSTPLLHRDIIDLASEVETGIVRSLQNLEIFPLWLKTLGSERRSEMNYEDSRVPRICPGPIGRLDDAFRRAAPYLSLEDRNVAEEYLAVLREAHSVLDLTGSSRKGGGISVYTIEEKNRLRHIVEDKIEIARDSFWEHFKTY